MRLEKFMNSSPFYIHMGKGDGDKAVVWMTLGDHGGILSKQLDVESAPYNPSRDVLLVWAIHELDQMKSTMIVEWQCNFYLFLDKLPIQEEEKDEQFCDAVIALIQGLEG